ncbi:hypothetical protein Taro_055700, partial [Colocasia esculenta]|nr:hypothetical protein [Colocasia esculenta]
MDPAFPGTISAMLHRTASGRRRLAPRTPEWEELSTSFLHLVDGVASSLLNSSIQSGDTVALPFPDSIESCAVMLAVMRCRARALPLLMAAYPRRCRGGTSSPSGRRPTWRGRVRPRSPPSEGSPRREDT